ncbi:MAG TPA: zinc ribbon domain-containing protein [Blastocatellia bacterium]|jgi:putative FmdB family regulatory protein|nr:zinc ribbon domain-containing protein [Blastocatellia bacterium]
MPIYEYICEKCGSHIEAIQKVSDAPLKRCQKCRGKLEKVVSRTSFQLKGAGWYLSDYSRKSTPETKDKPEKGADKKTETAPSSESK